MKPKSHYEPGDVITVQQALKICPISKTLMYGLIDDGTIPGFRVTSISSPRGRILVRRADVEAFMRRGFEKATPRRRESIDRIRRRREGTTR